MPDLLNWQPLYWREPAWLLAMLYPLLLLGWRRWRSGRVLDAYADRALQPWVRVAQPPGRRRAGQGVLMALCWVLLCLALAGPRLPLRDADQAGSAPGRLLAIVDLSRSMDAGDTVPSRRARAVQLLRGWLGQSPRPAIGLLLFAGRAHAYLPPTRDRRILDQYLAQLGQITLPTLGNDLAGALTLAQGWSAGEGPTRLLLLSDGDLDEAARARVQGPLAALREAGIALDVVGIGGASPVPLRDADGEWLLDAGQPVLSALQADWLRQLAASGGGRYLALEEAAAPALAAVWPYRPPRIAADELARVRWQELHPWLLAPAALLLVVLLVPLPAPRTAALLLLAPALAWLAEPARATDPAADAYALLQAGDYGKARDRYAALGGYAGRFGEGISCYRLADYDCARRAFADAAWLAADGKARGRAVFNLANSRFQLGDFERAIALYEDVIRQGAAVAAARANLAYTRELLAEVKRLAGIRGQAERRPARGPRSGASGLLPPDEGALRLDERKITVVPGPDGAAGRQQLLQRGLERLQLRTTGAGGTARGRGTTGWARREDLAASVPGAAIWQRLFEIDEGFPAPLQRPLPRPGERSW